MKRKNYSRQPEEYVVDLTRTTYRGEYVPNIFTVVHEAFSPEQALAYVLKKNNARHLYDKLAPEVDTLVTKMKQANSVDISDHGPVRKPEMKQGELFEIIEGEDFVLVR